MANTYVKIASVTVGAGGAANIDFQSIPATYDDLKLVFSLRYETNAGFVNLAFNNSTSNFTSKTLEGTGAAATSFTGTNYGGAVVGASDTASTFGNAELYIPNYAGSTNKSFSLDVVTENNGTTAYADLIAGLWSQTAAINRITLTLISPNEINQYSTAVLYGIKKS